jgi:predicted DNA-binding transcriptional regulator YafY
MRHEKAGSLIELARHLAASAEGMTLDEMAIALGVVRRSAERMRDALEALFPQMEVLREGTTKRYRIPSGLDGFFQTPTTAEILELTRAASSLRDAGHIARAEALDSLQRKVRAALKAKVLNRVSPDVEALARAEINIVRAGPRPFEDPEIVGKIRQAVMAMCAIRFRYSGGSNPGAERTVCPYGILFERMNYLVATELGSDQPRNWRLDRLRDVEVTDIPACPPASFDLAEFANQSFGVYQDSIEEVVLRVLPHGAEDAMGWRFHPSQSLTPHADGSILVRFASGGMLELAWHLFTWGDKIEILAPERLRAAMAEQLESCSAHHRKTNATNPVAVGV